jgi:hypothetical protein
VNQEEYDLERVRVYWDYRKDSNLGFLFAVLIPSILAIFLIAQSYIQANPPNLAMGDEVFLIGAIALVAYALVWLVRMRRIFSTTVELLDRVRKGMEIDTILPKALRNPTKKK